MLLIDSMIALYFRQKNISLITLSIMILIESAKYIFQHIILMVIITCSLINEWRNEVVIIGSELIKGFENKKFDLGIQ